MADGVISIQCVWSDADRPGDDALLGRVCVAALERAAPGAADVGEVFKVEISAEATVLGGRVFVFEPPDGWRRVGQEFQATTSDRTANSSTAGPVLGRAAAEVINDYLAGAGAPPQL